MHTIENLRSLAPIEEIDYNFLMSALADYKRPRDKVTELLKKEVLIRVKKGLYVFGPRYTREPYHKETLANLIFGPSYISKEYALSFHGLIPERVEVVTSMTTKRNKQFETPVGMFTYSHLNTAKYSQGVQLIELDAKHTVLMASPEKALADLAAEQRLIDNVQSYLDEDLRLDWRKLDKAKMNEIAAVYHNKNVTSIAEVLE